MDRDKNISCIVCTHKAPDTIQDLVESLKQQAWDSPDECVIIDNGISGERCEQLESMVAELSKSAIKCRIVVEKKPGLTAARLKGIEETTNPWLFFLDDDNYLGKEAIGNIRKTLISYQNIGGICPQIIPRWDASPPDWLVALGHQVLSYNSTRYSSQAHEFAVWRPGMIAPRPPGGGMFIHRRAVDAYVKLITQAEIMYDLCAVGSGLARGEDFILYNQVFVLGLSGVYDHSVLVYHQIPRSRMSYGYILKLIYKSNYSYGMMGLMRFGKINIIYSLMRGSARVCYEFCLQTIGVWNWRVPVSLLAALWGYFVGTMHGLFDKRCKRIRIDP